MEWDPPGASWCILCRGGKSPSLFTQPHGFPVLRVCTFRNSSGSVCSGVVVLDKTHPSLLLLELLSPQSLNYPHSYLFPCARGSTSQICSPNGCAGSRKQLPGTGEAEMVTHSPHLPGHQGCGVEPALHLQGCTRLKNIPARYASDFTAIKKFLDEFGGIFVQQHS